MENLQAWYNEGYIITICWEYYSLSDILSKTGTHLQQVHFGIIIRSHSQYSKVYIPQIIASPYSHGDEITVEIQLGLELGANPLSLNNFSLFRSFTIVIFDGWNA